jgi:hypothetical protein
MGGRNATGREIGLYNVEVIAWWRSYRCVRLRPSRELLC